MLYKKQLNHFKETSTAATTVKSLKGFPNKSIFILLKDGTSLFWESSATTWDSSWKGHPI